MFSFEPMINNDRSFDQTKWRPLNSNDKIGLNKTNDRKYDLNENHNLIRSKLKFNSSYFQFEHANLACWASNSIGQQIEPCLFSLLTIGKFYSKLY